MADVVEMVQLSPTMEEGLIVKWLKNVGDPVEAGDLIAEVETDKATMEMESFFDGVLLRIIVPEGQAAPVGTAIAVIGEEGEDADAALSEAGGGAPAEPAAAASEPEDSEPDDSTPEAEQTAPSESARETSPTSSTSTSAGGGRLRVSPVARKVAADRGVDLQAVSGSGPQGRIVLKDVEEAIATAAATPAAAPSAPRDPAARAPVSLPSFDGAAPEEQATLSPMRRTIARRLTEAWAAPAFMLTRDLDVSALLALRAQVNATLEAGGHGEKLSVNDFLIRAVAIALRDVPEMNVAFSGDALVRYGRVDIGMAVALDGGLITPVIRGAEHLGVRQIAASVRDLVTRARDRKLAPEEYAGATFSISNLGMFGIDHFTAVLNPPGAGILAVGTVRTEPVVNAQREIVVGDRMAVTLTCDHRAVDGAVGATWLKRFAEVIESPLELLL